MSLGDLYHKNKFSLQGELKPDRWGRRYHIPNQEVEIWSMYLGQMRWCWEQGESTEVETDFFEYFNPAGKPTRWPEWLSR